MARKRVNSATTDSHGAAVRAWPIDRYMGSASALKIGTWIFLLSDAFSFSGLLLAYGILRAASKIWWPSGEPNFGIGEAGLIEQGLVFGRSARATTFFLITSFHGFHVLSGVVLLSVMLVRTAMGKHDGGNYDAIEAAGLFWHFVDLVWILVFTLVYLIPAQAGG